MCFGNILVMFKDFLKLIITGITVKNTEKDKCYDSVYCR